MNDKVFVRHRALGALIAGTVALQACAETPAPVLMMRLRMNDAQSVETWKESFKAIKDHPGCCDEIWFSTGCGVPSLDWHRANAKVLAVAIADVKAVGIVPSLQFQATLGHGDGIIAANMFTHKTWTGWTGCQGVEDRECNCPRQPAFLAYLREVSEIYAKLGFASLWLDDDLRSRNHFPATGWDVKQSGCWCETCIAAYNRETGGTWTRETLAEAVKADPARQASWRTFTLDSLVGVAKTVAGVFHEVSPKTTMGLQQCADVQNVDEILAVLKALYETNGRKVGFRGGGGAYGDDAPDSVLLKSLCSGHFRQQLGNPDYVKVWVPEIESYPRTYYSISTQGVLVQAFSGLMYGLNGVSYFISNPAQESPSLYGETYWRTLADASPCLKGYARTIEGCTAVGFTVPTPKEVGMLRAAIPVLLGPGKSVGSLTEEEMRRTLRNMSSRSVQDLRERLDKRAGGLPACICSPFAGLMQIHVDQDGRFRALALMNARIATQGSVRVRLSQLPDDTKAMIWHEMGCNPLRIPLERVDGKVFATIPSIGAWNGGYFTSESQSVKAFPEFSSPRAITSGPHDHFFANYFAINAWSPDNRYALVLETDIKDKLPDGAPCTLGLVDMEDGNRFIPVTTTRCWNFQEAAMAHWMPCEKDTFVFNDLRDGKFCAVVMNWKTKAERVYPFPVSAVSEDGTWAVSINYARLFLTRPDYGYAGDGQDPRKGVVFPEDDGLWRVDLRTGEAKLIVPTSAVKDMVPKVGPTGMSYLCHTVISKDFKRIYFLSRSVEESMEGVKKFKGVNWFTTAFTCRADGSEIRRCFPDGWDSSHFNWKPNLSERDARTMIVTCKWLDKIYTHVEFTVGEEDYPRQVGGKAMNFDGHCIYTPDGNFISGDGYWDETFNRHWKMVRLADNKVKDIGSFFVPEQYRDIYCRCDLHPRWRPDGKQIGFNSVHEGSRQVYVMDVK